MRLFAWIADRFYISTHYADSQLIADELKAFGMTKPIEVLLDKLKYTEKYEKIAHEGFNVLVMIKNRPKKDQKLRDWIYGIDIIKDIEKKCRQLPKINLVVVDGTKDMSKIYPIIDFYLRPNRHDGSSRMRQECEIQEIPYYWTNKNPNKNEAIKKIKFEYSKRFKL